MRQGTMLLCLLTLLGAACSDSKSQPKGGDQDRDADVGDASTTSSLPRPTLERPPRHGLPADLRPPR
jgi:hypothetical protein